MLKNQHILLAVSILLILGSCKQTLQVLPVRKIAVADEALIYNLPKTAIIIEAEVEKTINYKGPFADFADLYFQSNNTVKRDETKYSLKSVKITTSPLPDSLHYYGILTNKDFKIANNICLSKDLFLLGINTNIQFQQQKKDFVINLSNEKERNPDYGDLSVKSVRETVYDTVWHEIFEDSVFKKVPKIYKRKQFKSPERQAKELATQIFRLRDDRLALLKGVTDANNFPDGESVSLMIKELDKYEKQYMTMFTGQKRTSTKKHKFIYIPKNDQPQKSVELFKFSEKYGILPAEINKGNIFILQIKKANNLYTVQEFEKFRKKKLAGKKKKNQGFAYRIPGEASIKLSFKNTTIFQEQIKVAQFGVISKIPTNIIENTKNEILFYPELGSLKKISSRKN